MTRKEFIKVCGILGITLPYQAASSTYEDNKVTAGNPESVLIIGAGAAGLAAGHLLNQKNIKFQILEASPHYGGRMKKTDSFADFPIPLGAEWLTVDNKIFNEIIGDKDISVDVHTLGYQESDSYALWQNESLITSELGSFNYKKFIGKTWFDFFEEYVVPSVAKDITYNAAVHAIDYSQKKVTVSTQNAKYEADQVIVTVPLKMLQNSAIDFSPKLPKNKRKAIKNAVVWDGLKVFLEFSEKFYPTFTEFKITPETSGQVAYFDAAYGQNTNKNILGLFAVGEPSKNYISLEGELLKTYILNELDKIFSNKATPSYVNHIVQNWSTEPYIEGAYLHDHEEWELVSTLSEPVAGKVYFAGDAYTDGNDWGSVHTATRAAKEAIEKILA